jgi:hypothetical protein
MPLTADVSIHHLELWAMDGEMLWTCTSTCRGHVHRHDTVWCYWHALMVQQFRNAALIIYRYDGTPHVSAPGM